MAFNITQFGRVEFDPTTVPTASVRTTGSNRGDEFVRHLDEATQRDRSVEAAPMNSVDDSAPSSEETVPQPREDGPPADDGPPARTDSDSAQQSAQPATGTRPTPSADATQINEGEAPASRKDAGKGAGASPSLLPLAERSAGDATVIATQAAAKQVAPAGQAIAASTATQSAQPATADAIPGTRATTAAGERARSTEVTPGYRTLHQPTLQLAETARDSIFRQVAMRLNSQGGEMNLLLDPPELGELEIKMVVEGNQMRLTIVAERPEVALTMQKHMAELRAQLEAQGMTITEAEVRSRDAHADGSDRANRDGLAHSHDAETEDVPPEDRRSSPRGGFITAEGLDFWV